MHHGSQGPVIHYMSQQADLKNLQVKKDLNFTRCPPLTNVAIFFNGLTFKRLKIILCIYTQTMQDKY
jgi:hypothetical protein